MTPRQIASAQAKARAWRRSVLHHARATVARVRRVGNELLTPCPAAPACQVRRMKPSTPPGAHSRCVMKCHVLSCEGHDRLSAGLANAPSVWVLHVIPPSRFVPFALPAACLRRDPFSRVSHACAPARRAGAVRAPDCARASHVLAGRTSPVRSVGVFSRRREAGDEAARGCRLLLSHSTTILQRSSPFRELFHNS